MSADLSHWNPDHISFDMDALRKIAMDEMLVRSTCIHITRESKITLMHDFEQAKRDLPPGTVGFYCYDHETGKDIIIMERSLISVNDHKPLTDDRVLIFDESDKTFAVGWFDGSWECWDDCWSSRNVVTHWMPLPYCSE